MQVGSELWKTLPKVAITGYTLAVVLLSGRPGQPSTTFSGSGRKQLSRVDAAGNPTGEPVNTNDYKIVVEAPKAGGYGGRCYITTATCRTLGRPDGCPELTRLRWFRDLVLARTPAGRRDIAAYYAVAPGVVSAIDRAGDPAGVYRRVYAAHLRPALRAVDAGDHAAAYRLYRDMVRVLRGEYPG
jgi:hypothetical protein